MDRWYLASTFVCAFLALLLAAAYSLVLTGGKLNGEDLSPAAIYNRAIYGQQQPTPEPRFVDPRLKPKTELDLINEQKRLNGQSTPESSFGQFPGSSASPATVVPAN